MTKKKPRKPTMNEMKTAVENVIIHMSNIQRQINKLDSVVSSWIDFTGKKDKWVKWVNKEVAKMKEEDGKSTESSDQGNKEIAK